MMLVLNRPGMNMPALFLAPVLALLLATGCGKEGGDMGREKTRILFLHHSTGRKIWDQGVKRWFKDYNREHGTRYVITEREFPKDSPYGWKNYPYDYWKIWVDNAGPDRYMDEPTLEILAGDYDMIVFKHCFPVSDILADTGEADVASEVRSLENYRLQYEALKEKMRSFPGTRFLVWTGAALVEQRSDSARGQRASEFARWVREEWDEPGDNIFVWDFFTLETEGGIHMKEQHAGSPTDSHPNEEFASRAAPLFCRRIVDVMEGRVQ